MSMTLLDEVRSGTGLPLVPISLDQYQHMIDSGILLDGDSIELLDGLLVRKDRSGCGGDIMTHHPRHALLIKRLQRLFIPVCESVGWHVQIQLPVALTNFNAPEPDVAIVRGTEENYADRHPGPSDLLVVIEVADSSLSIDRTTKQRLYATAGIPKYWVINLPESLVDVYESPDAAAGKYARQTTYVMGQTISWSISPQQCLEIHVAELLR